MQEMEEVGVVEYKQRYPYFIWIVLGFSLIIAITGFVLSCWAVWTIKNNLPQNFQVQFGPITHKLAAKFADESAQESERVSVTTTQGVLLEKSGTTIQATTSNFGLATQKLSDGSVYVVNTGIVQMDSAAGVAVTSTPVLNTPIFREDGSEYTEEERSSVIYPPTGYKITLQNTGVVTATAPRQNIAPPTKRSVNEETRAITYTSEGPGMLIQGIDNSNLEFYNTGVINLSSNSSGLVIGGNNSYPILTLSSYTPIINIYITINFNDLSANKSKAVLIPQSSTARYAILNVASDSTNSAAWGGGNAIIDIETDTVEFYNFDATTLAQVGLQSFVTGNSSPGIKPIAGFSANQASQAGETIYFKYSSTSSTPYTSGSLAVNFMFIQMAE